LYDWLGGNIRCTSDPESESDRNPYAYGNSIHNSDALSDNTYSFDNTIDNAYPYAYRNPDSIGYSYPYRHTVSVSDALNPRYLI